MQAKWLAYFHDICKEQALNGGGKVLEPCVEYGKIIYQSSEYLDRRWLVANYGEEYNVFVEYKTTPNRFERLLAASFVSKERAVGFAAEMFLICCGRLRRSNRRNLDLTKMEKGYRII